jgi:hypothetical protein
VSRFAYDASKNAAVVYDLPTLLMAAMHNADPVDLDRLREAFPRLHNEFSAYRSAESTPGPVSP